MGFLADLNLEIIVRGQHIERPRLQAAKHLGHVLVKSPNFVPFAHPPTVRRVADQTAVLLLAAGFGEIPLLEVDVVVHAGLLGMVSGKAQGLGVNVRTGNAQRQLGQGHAARRVSGALPKLFG